MEIYRSSSTSFSSCLELTYRDNGSKIVNTSRGIVGKIRDMAALGFLLIYMKYEMINVVGDKLNVVAVDDQYLSRILCGCGINRLPYNTKTIWAQANYVSNVLTTEPTSTNS